MQSILLLDALLFALLALVPLAVVLVLLFRDLTLTIAALSVPVIHLQLKLSYLLQ